MSGRWFRFYDCALDDPKVQRLPAPVFKTWINLLCLASRHNGKLPSETDIAWTLRMDEEQLAEQFTKLREAGLIDAVYTTEDGMICSEPLYLTPHNWSERQYNSDSSAERMRKHRAAKKSPNGDGDGPNGGQRASKGGDVTGDENGDVTVTLQKRIEVEEIQNREDEDTADADHHPRVYAFEAGKIRLVETDLARWVKAFVNINVEAELHSLSDWAGKQPDWFHAVKGALGKRDRAALLAKEKIKAEAAAGAKTAASKSFLERGRI